MVWGCCCVIMKNNREGGFGMGWAALASSIAEKLSSKLLKARMSRAIKRFGREAVEAIVPGMETNR